MINRTPPFRRAALDDASMLEDLQRRSSSHWGYPPDHFDWAPGALDIPESYLRDNLVYILEREGKPVGFYGLTKDDGVLMLDKLFVDVDQIGQGHGRLLWRHAVEIARSLGYRTLDIGSDPNAAAFYEAMGAVRLGERQTANPAWTVQVLRYPIPDRVIRPARIEEAPILHELTQRSVMYWGYPPEFLDWGTEAIAVTPEVLARSTSAVLEIGEDIAGYSTLEEKDGRLYMDKLFLEPDWIGLGLGKTLWLHAIDQARALGWSELHLYADPNAAPFYAAMGAERTGEVVTDWPDWALQVFEFRMS